MLQTWMAVMKRVVKSVVMEVVKVNVNPDMPASDKKSFPSKSFLLCVDFSVEKRSHTEIWDVFFLLI